MFIKSNLKLFRFFNYQKKFHLHVWNAGNSFISIFSHAQEFMKERSLISSSFSFHISKLVGHRGKIHPNHNMSQKLTETSLEYPVPSRHSLIENEDFKESHSNSSTDISQETVKSPMESEVQSLEDSSLMSSPSAYYGCFNSPVSSTSNKVVNSVSRKRKLSISECDYLSLCTFPNRKSTGHFGRSSFDVSDRTWNRGRRSLPIERAYTSPKHQLDPVKQSPLQVSPQTPNRPLQQNLCKTDQTPYSPVHSYHRSKRLRTDLPSYNPSDLIKFKFDEGFIDSHCHLDFLFQRQGYEGSYKDYMKKHEDTFPICYKGCLAIFCNPHSFNKKHLWQEYLEEENVWASFGCHPHNAKDYNDEVEVCLRSALEHPKVRALGEIGLDYSNRNNCLQKFQHEAFKRQLKIALEKDLPLVIHCREAHEDGMAIMKEIVPKDYLIHLHCFTDTWELANKWMQEFPNLFIGLTNVVTFPSAESVHEVAKKIPLKRLLLETDAPYFVPRPLQRSNPGTRYSHPGMAIHVAAQVAALKGDSLSNVLHHARQNTKKMYKI